MVKNQGWMDSIPQLAHDYQIRTTETASSLRYKSSLNGMALDNDQRVSYLLNLEREAHFILTSYIETSAAKFGSFTSALHGE